MALANYTDLQTSIANWLHRSDLTSVIPDLIALAETKIFGDLESRQQDTITTLSTVANTETVALPSDFINIKTVAVITSPVMVLDYMSPDQYEFAYPWSNTGTPRAYTIIGGNLYLAPIPDAVYSIRLAYQSRIPALATSGTNWLMTQFPSVYLYGTLLQAAPYIKDSARITEWDEFYKAAIAAVNRQDWSAGASPRVRADVTP